MTERCMVCRGLLHEDDHIVECPECGNPAHYGHLAEWLKTGKGCPICKYYFHLEDQEPELPEFQVHPSEPIPPAEILSSATCISTPPQILDLNNSNRFRDVTIPRTVLDDNIIGGEDIDVVFPLSKVVPDDSSPGKENIDVMLTHKYYYA